MTEPKAYSYIRFSTPGQANGDSLRRQTEASTAYAQKKGLILDDALDMQDLGLSAYKGVHRTHGALGVFLRLVEAGKVSPGSILIVEDLDRLSRQEPLTALDQFSLLIHSGIRIVTLSNGIEYDRQSIRENPGQLYLTMGEIIRAHQESELKSKRLKAVWKSKREDLQNGDSKRKLTAKAPLWLKLSEDKTEFIQIPEAVQTIKRAFEMKLSGTGNVVIARILNQDPIAWKPPISGRNKTGGWRCAYITKILSYKAVIGEFQPCKMTKQEGKKKQYVPMPEGKPISNYYPAIIDPDLFYAVQDHIKQNSILPGNAGGRTKKAGNLFTYVIKCGRCKGAMHFINKGNTPRGGKYLYCDASRRKLGTCNAKSIRYDEFERLIFDNFEELNISEIMPGQDEAQAQVNDLRRRIDAGNAKARELAEQETNLIDSIATTADKRIRQALDKRLVKVMDDKQAVIQETKELKRTLSDVEQASKNLSQMIDHAREIYSLMDQTTDEQGRINLRMKLRTQIRKLVDVIEVYPLDQPYKARQEDKDGIITTMDSKFIEKVRIKFKGSRKLRIIGLLHRFDSLDIAH